MADATAAVEETTIVLDLGSKSRKQVKRLKRGGGSLMAKVEDTVGQLRSEGELENGGIVVVVVKQKPKSKFKLFG